MSLRPVADMRVAVRDIAVDGDTAFLTIDAPPQFDGALPGQFALLRADHPAAPFLGRPLSIVSVAGNRAQFAFNVIGPGTTALAALTVGDGVFVVGPLGSPFSAVVCAAEDLSIVCDRTHVGTLLALAGARPPRTTTVFSAGYGTAAYATFRAAFTARGAIVTVGEPDALPSFLAATDGPVAAGGDTAILAALIRAIDPACHGEAALHAMMGCGLGACLSCVARLASGKMILVCERTIVPLSEWRPQA